MEHSHPPATTRKSAQLSSSAMTTVVAAISDALTHDALELYFDNHPTILLQTASTAEQLAKLLAHTSPDAIILDATDATLVSDVESLAARFPYTARIALVPLPHTDAIEQLRPSAVHLILMQPLPMAALERAIDLCIRYCRLAQAIDHYKNTAESHSDLQQQYRKLYEQYNSISQILQQREQRFRIAMHDLQNPLANLSALLGELRARREQLPSLAQEHVELCALSVELLRSLVEDILSVSQLDADIRPERRPIDVAQLLRSCARRFTAFAEQKNIWINLIVPPALPTLHADEHLLSKALDNLVSNAIKYTPPGGAVSLEAECTDQALLLRVRDTGLGLTADDIAAAFQEFRRLSSAPTAGEPSTGLGLYIVRRIVELHGGAVRAESPGKGHGATFTIELTINQPQSV
ncbi:MAG: HAMP domain-containing histidine kinase [Chlorobi bacterium]|nr:HAMP domain-containing histidine kinase [Chlorobiota bacterium]